MSSDSIPLKKAAKKIHFSYVQLCAWVRDDDCPVLGRALLTNPERDRLDRGEIQAIKGAVRQKLFGGSLTDAEGRWVAEKTAEKEFGIGRPFLRSLRPKERERDPAVRARQVDAVVRVTRGVDKRGRPRRHFCFKKPWVYHSDDLQSFLAREEKDLWTPEYIFEQYGIEWKTLRAWHYTGCSVLGGPLWAKKVRTGKPRSRGLYFRPADILAISKASFFTGELTDSSGLWVGTIKLPDYGLTYARLNGMLRDTRTDKKTGLRTSKVQLPGEERPRLTLRQRVEVVPIKTRTGRDYKRRLVTHVDDVRAVEAALREQRAALPDPGSTLTVDEVFPKYGFSRTAVILWATKECLPLGIGELLPSAYEWRDETYQKKGRAVVRSKRFTVYTKTSLDEVSNRIGRLKEEARLRKEQISSAKSGRPGQCPDSLTLGEAVTVFGSPYTARVLPEKVSESPPEKEEMTIAVVWAGNRCEKVTRYATPYLKRLIGGTGALLNASGSGEVAPSAASISKPIGPEERARRKSVLLPLADAIRPELSLDVEALADTPDDKLFESFLRLLEYSVAKLDKIDREAEQHHLDEAERHRQRLTEAQKINEGLAELRSAVEAGPASARAAEPEPPTIWSHGNLSYSRDGVTCYVASVEENNVLTAFLNEKRAMDTYTLTDKSGVTNPARVIKTLSEKWGGLMADAIRTPGGKKNSGGYFIAVRKIEVR